MYLGDTTIGVAASIHASSLNDLMLRKLDVFGSLMLVAMVAGCSAEASMRDGTFGGYASTLKKYQADEPVVRTIGKIPLTPGGTSDRTSAGTAPGMADVMLHFEGIENGRICFTDIDQSTSEIGYESPEQRLAHVEIWIEAVENLDTLKARPLRPSPGTKLDSAEVASDDHRRRESDYEKVNEVVWKVCGPMPATTEQTHYLAAVVRDNTTHLDGLILWEVAP